jgi:hypothetical protein
MEPSRIELSRAISDSDYEFLIDKLRNLSINQAHSLREITDGRFTAFLDEHAPQIQRKRSFTVAEYDYLFAALETILDKDIGEFRGAKRAAEEETCGSGDLAMPRMKRSRIDKMVPAKAKPLNVSRNDLSK